MELTYPTGVTLPQHAHAQSGFCLLLRGTYEIRCGKHILVCKPGTLTFTKSGWVHSNRISEAVRCFGIEMAPAWWQRANEHLKVSRGPVHFDKGSLPWLAMGLYREFQEEDELSPLAIEGLALELLAGTARHFGRISESSDAGWLQRATSFLHERFQDPLTLNDVAEIAGVHRVSLARAFRRAHHCTVGEYVRKLRVEFACQKLASSNESLVEIALSAGFSEHSQFSRTFKRLTGLTPSQFRSKSRSG